VRANGRLGQDLGSVGYTVAYATARDNLSLGSTVVADSVNPIGETRDSWLEVANQAGARVVEIELLRSDLQDHRRQVESRTADIDGHQLPTWADVVARAYQPWTRPHLIVDTSGRTVKRL